MTSLLRLIRWASPWVALGLGLALLVVFLKPEWLPRPASAPGAEPPTATEAATSPAAAPGDPAGGLPPSPRWSIRRRPS